MAKRYFTVAAPATGDVEMWWYRTLPPLSHPTCFEEERRPRDTGLVDARGNKIMTDDPRGRIGFLS